LFASVNSDATTVRLPQTQQAAAQFGFILKGWGSARCGKIDRPALCIRARRGALALTKPQQRPEKILAAADKPAFPSIPN
jgi:hypothetical protein